MAIDTTYGALVAIRQDGNMQVPAGNTVELAGAMTVDSGGSVTYASGAALTLAAGATLTINGVVTNTAAVKSVKVPLVASDVAGGVFAWLNPEAGDILVIRATVDVTTVATGACTLDIGGTSVSAATLSDTLLDGIDVHSATGQFDNLLAVNAGTNGQVVIKVPVGKWVTASKASGATAGMVGNAYIEYVIV